MIDSVCFGEQENKLKAKGREERIFSSNNSRIVDFDSGGGEKVFDILLVRSGEKYLRSPVILNFWFAGYIGV